MSERPTFEELKNRIQRDVHHFGGRLPERTAIAWYGYIGALIEWDMLSVSDHARLCRILPSLEDNPASQILLGRPDEE